MYADSLFCELKGNFVRRIFFVDKKKQGNAENDREDAESVSKVA